MALFEPAIKWLTKLPSTFLAGPPKGVFNPEYLTANKWMKRFNAEWKRAGFGAAYNKARMESTMRKGTFVGKDKNGNSYFEDKTAPYGRTRWVEYPTPPGVWVIEMKYDGSMVSPEWHGWLHYTHDKTGPEMVAEFEKPFVQPHTVNQSMLRPEFDQPTAFHQPPGQMGQRAPRGRVGNKYESWSGSPTGGDPALRNYADNAKTLHIP